MITTAPGPLDGIWNLFRAEMDGETAPEIVVQKTELELREGGYYVRFDGEIRDEGAFALTESGAHPALRLRASSGTNAGRTILGIYQHKGDLLRICYGLDGSAPAEFKTKPDSQRYLASYRRRVAEPEESAEAELT